jgi:hypothetical protein
MTQYLFGEHKKTVMFFFCMATEMTRFSKRKKKAFIRKV